MPTCQFAHLSDTHINREGKDTFLGADTLGGLRQALAHVANTGIDFIAITGDIVHEGDAEDYKALRALVQQAEKDTGVPVVLCLGNHDNRENFFAHYLETEPKPFYCETVWVDGLRIISLDSKVGAHDIHGEIEPEQMKWLRAELATPAPDGTLLLMHHPPVLTGPMAGHGMASTPALLETIKGSDVLGILSGHTHFSNFCMLEGGVLSATAASTGFGFAMDDESVQMTQRCGFNTGTVQNGQLHISTVQLAEEEVLATFSMAQMQAMSSEEFKPEDYEVK